MTTTTQIEGVTGAAQVIGTQVAKQYGGPIGQAAATYLLGEVSWTASTTDLIAKLQAGTATGEDVADVFSKSAAVLAGFGVLAGLAAPMWLTAAGAAGGAYFLYKTFVPAETKVLVWNGILSFPLFFVFQPIGIMPPIAVHADC